MMSASDIAHEINSLKGKLVYCHENEIPVIRGEIRALLMVLNGGNTK